MPKYLYEQEGVVAEIHPTKKAVVTFNDGGVEHRGLLWIDKLICEDGHKVVDKYPDPSIETWLQLGDLLVFDCHVYDNVNNTDRCGWYLLRAQRAADVGPPGDFCANVMATIDELTPSRGFATFRTPGLGDHQRAVFVPSRVYVHGERLPAGARLYDYLEEDQKVFLDAEHGHGRLENADWYATIVCLGHRPQVSVAPASGEFPEEVLAEDGGVRASLASALFPELAAAEGRSRRLPPLEPVPSRRETALRLPVILPSPALSQEKWGYVATLLNDEYGVLMWQRAPRRYDSVLFHRTAAHLFDLNLKNYDLRHIFKKGDHLRFEAERSEHPEAYKWKAYSVWVDES